MNQKGKMWLTKNEKKVLKILLEDAKISDTDIAKELDISSQAVGRIKKELEEEKVIEGYTIRLNEKMLGLNILTILRINIDDCEDGLIKEIEDKMKKYPEIFILLKTISGKREFRCLAGFRSMEDLERFMDEEKTIKDKNRHCYTTEITILSSNGILKHSMNELYNKLIDSCGTKNLEVEIN